MSVGTFQKLGKKWNVLQVFASDFLTITMQSDFQQIEHQNSPETNGRISCQIYLKLLPPDNS